MEITFGSTKLEKTFNSDSLLQREYGQEMAKKIKARMAVLRAAPSLALVPTAKPDRCHPLTGNRAGQFAVDLQHPFRLIFEPDADSLPKKEDGGIDLEQVVSVLILGVEDYH